QRREWFPPALSPFQLEDRVHPELSLGLRHDGRVIGWLVCHQVGEGLAQFTAMFVEPGHPRIGRGVPLVAEAASPLPSSDATRAIFAIDAENRPMIRFFERRLRSHIAGESEMLRSIRRLAG